MKLPKQARGAGHGSLALLDTNILTCWKPKLDQNVVSMSKTTVSTQALILWVSV